VRKLEGKAIKLAVTCENTALTLYMTYGNWSGSHKFSTA
jgi:hypothetical protein